MKKYAIGTDVGGSHLSCSLVDLSNGTIVENTRAEGNIDNQASAENILQSWVDVLLQTIDKADKNELAGIGFGMPGPFEYTTGIARFEKVAKYENLNGVDVASRLSGMLGLESKKYLHFMNDASAFAVGEAWVGSATGAKRSISITLGTGFGSAFISDGIPVVRGSEVPKLGCVWHLPFGEGIADEYFSTRWFVKRYAEETGINANGAKDVAAAATENSTAVAIFEEYGRNMAEFLVPWLNRFKTDILVIGGNIAGAYHLFGHVFEDILKIRGINTRIKLSTLKENATIIGSARMLDPAFLEKIKPVLPFM